MFGNAVGDVSISRGVLTLNGKSESEDAYKGCFIAVALTTGGTFGQFDQLWEEGEGSQVKYGYYNDEYWVYVIQQAKEDPKLSIEQDSIGSDFVTRNDNLVNQRLRLGTMRQVTQRCKKKWERAEAEILDLD